MRSPSAVAGALVLILGALLAVVASSAFENAAEIIIHAALGVSFALFARAAFDFGIPTSIAWAACATIGVLAGVFLLQGVADLLQSEQLRHFAYEVLGQRLEKILGYAFVLWCLALVVGRSRRKTRALGAVVLAVIMAAELYGFAVTYGGGRAPEVLKLLYLPLFVWLLLEGVKPQPPSHGPSKFNVF
jgi:hypothetical protein